MNLQIDAHVDSRRSLLSETFKVFDVLSLYLPVTIRCRLLMRQTRILKNTGWDTELDKTIADLWRDLHADLIKLKDISFPRQVFSTDDDALCLNLHSDASSVCYGFAAYIKGSFGPRLLLAKAKTATVQALTLPVLNFWVFI